MTISPRSSPLVLANSPAPSTPPNLVDSAPDLFTRSSAPVLLVNRSPLSSESQSFDKELESPTSNELVVGGVWNWTETSSNSTGSRESLRGPYSLIEKERTQWLASNELMGGSNSSLGTATTGGVLRSSRGDEIDSSSSISSYRDTNHRDDRRSSPSLGAIGDNRTSSPARPPIGSGSQTPSFGSSPIGQDTSRPTSKGSIHGKPNFTTSSVGGGEGGFVGGFVGGNLSEKPVSQLSAQQQQQPIQQSVQQQNSPGSQNQQQQLQQQQPASSSVSSQSNHTSETQIQISAQHPTSESVEGPSSDTTSQPTHTQTRASSTLWMGDLESWMDEGYIRKCCVIMGWVIAQEADRVIIKVIRGSSPSSGYSFLTFPNPQHAQAVLARFSQSPPTLMPNSTRTFKLNWATGLPGVPPKWEGEWSVFVGEIAREVGEAELVALFSALFPSTKSAKIMCDPSTGLSRGYGFVRFGEENDMKRALILGGAGGGGGTGLSLRGRTLRISEASGSSGTASRSGSTSGPSGSAAPTPNLASEVATLPSLGISPTQNSTSLPQIPNHQSIPANLQAASNPNAFTGLPHQSPLGPVPSPLANGSPFFGTGANTSNLLSSPHISLNGTPQLNGLGQLNPHGLGQLGQLNQLGGQGGLGVGVNQRTLAALGGGLGQGLSGVGGVGNMGLGLGGGIQNQSPAGMALLQQQLDFLARSGQMHNGPQVPQPQQHQLNMNDSSTQLTQVLAQAVAGGTNPMILQTLLQTLAGATSSSPHSNDPNNTTVFVGGLPACISEETLRSFFQHFGEITYVKIPPNKGCGFVQFVRRQDAEMAIAKMHDFPIHGKSRIRLSWGRSQTDKQVEHVKKLASALHVPVENVWRMVQGQDNATIKQIAAMANMLGNANSPAPSLGLNHASPGLGPSPLSNRDFNAGRRLTEPNLSNPQFFNRDEVSRLASSALTMDDLARWEVLQAGGSLDPDMFGGRFARHGSLDVGLGSNLRLSEYTFPSTNNNNSLSPSANTQPQANDLFGTFQTMSEKRELKQQTSGHSLSNRTTSPYPLQSDFSAGSSPNSTLEKRVGQKNLGLGLGLLDDYHQPVLHSRSMPSLNGVNNTSSGSHGPSGLSSSATPGSIEESLARFSLTGNNNTSSVDNHRHISPEEPADGFLNATIFPPSRSHSDLRSRISANQGPSGLDEPRGYIPRSLDPNQLSNSNASASDWGLSFRDS